MQARAYATARTSLAILLAMALAWGCGDDSDTTGTSTTATTLPTATTAPATTTPATTTPATTAATDDAQIRSVFTAFFNGADRDVDKKVSLLQDGERYRQMLVAADADPRSQQLRAEVRAVRLVGSGECTSAGVTSPCAIVTFDLLLGAFPALAGHDGPAVKIGGSWKVGAKAWCDVVAIGGETCPS